jgi:hypothetical protein
MDDFKYYTDSYKPSTSAGNELANLLLANYNNKINPENGSAGGSYGSAGSGGDNSGAYEDDFPELTAAKFSQLRLEGVSPIPNLVPSNNTDYCF